MALKDWNKVTSNAWRKKKNPGKSLLYIDEEPMSGTYQSKKYKVIFTINGGKRIIIKQMASRYIALKFAKAYMITH